VTGAEPGEPSDETGAVGRRATARVLVGGAVGALILTALSVPAGAVVGATFGSALAATARPVVAFPRAGRRLGLVLIGCSAGLGVRAESVETFLRLVAPVVLGVLMMVAVGAAAAWYLHRRHGVDPMTALFACAPGGISEISIQAAEAGARLEVVLTIHLARILVVVLVVLPLVVSLLGHPG
jgi:membrane AbrB-like protein